MATGAALSKFERASGGDLSGLRLVLRGVERLSKFDSGIGYRFAAGGLPVVVELPTQTANRKLESDERSG
jgi:hypothetical protein